MPAPEVLETAEEFEAGWLEYNPLHARFRPPLQPRLALGLACRRHFSCRCAERRGRRWLIPLISRPPEHEDPARAGQCNEYGRHLARAVDLRRRLPRRRAQE